MTLIALSIILIDNIFHSKIVRVSLHSHDGLPGATSLEFGPHRVPSTSGIQQGDLLGPLLFATALQPLAAELQAGPLGLAIFFLDDSVLAGTMPRLAAVLARIQRKITEVGLT